MASRLADWLRARLSRRTRRRLRWLAGYPALVLKARRHYRYDRRRFMEWSSASGRANRRAQLEAWIMGDAHKIEKALALPSPRPGFGAGVIRRLIENLRDYGDLHGWDRSSGLALACLEAYHRFNLAHGLPDEETAEAIADLRARHGGLRDEPQGGSLRVHRADIHRAGQLDLAAFFESRHSVRQFAEEPVDPALIEQAVRLAQKTPTVCNRQSLRVHAYFDAEERQRVLACQLGNRGFGHQAACVLVVTCDLQTFYSVGERNQAWIDGGLFSMSLVYALHSLGLGSCCLNWSVEIENDRALRRVMDLPGSEIVIMQIAVGHLLDEFDVARSERKPIDEVLVRHPPR
jgi:nitroreductase